MEMGKTFGEIEKLAAQGRRCVKVWSGRCWFSFLLGNMSTSGRYEIVYVRSCGREK